MNKPDWKDAPEWAAYLAMDDDGKWYWFEVEPVLADGFWALPRGDWAALNHTFANWKSTKERRPTAQTNRPHPDGFAGGLTEREEK